MTSKLTHTQNIALQNFGQRQIAAAKIGDLQSLKDNFDGMHALLQQCGLEKHLPGGGFTQQALTHSCKGGHVPCVAFLIEHTDISYGECVAVRAAVEGNHFDCLKLLLDHITLPLNMYQFCINETVHYNQPQCLQVLVDHFQDGADYNMALVTSAVRDQYECVDILYSVGDPKSAWMRIENYHDDEDVGLYLAAKLQQERLTAEVSVGASLPTPKKM